MAVTVSNRTRDVAVTVQVGQEDGDVTARVNWRRKGKWQLELAKDRVESVPFGKKDGDVAVRVTTIATWFIFYLSGI